MDDFSFKGFLMISFNPALKEFPFVGFFVTDNEIVWLAIPKTRTDIKLGQKTWLDLGTLHELRLEFEDRKHLDEFSWRHIMVPMGF